MDENIILWDQKIKLRDGVQISSDIYGIDHRTRKPAMVFRTPYGKTTDAIISTAKYFASHGYVFVSCDVRGRGDSDGIFIPYQNEGRDGFDILQWVSRQSWCDGRTATWGASYSARVQWYTAELNPTSLKAMISIVTPSDPFVENPTGLPSLLDISWEFSTSSRSLQNFKAVDWNSVYNHLPLVDMPSLTGREMPHWKERLKHQAIDEYTKSISYQNSIHRIAIPVLHISGWYDDEQIGTPLNFQRLSESKNAKVASNQFLLMGPWGHNVNSCRTVGEFDFGPNSIIDLLEFEKNWLNSQFFNKKREKKVPEKVRLFLMGKNKWMNFDQWPPGNSTEKRFYLSSIAGANSSFGDGTLTEELPSYESKSDTFTYNPERPVPFISDQNHVQIGGPDDYSAIERRDDVLVYTSKELPKSMTVIGPVSLTLYVASNTYDTDFTGKLLVVKQDGRAIRLSDGILRMRYREGFDKTVKTIPGKLYKIDLNLWNTAYQFAKGEGIRVEVSSSAFPKYARNLNLFDDQSKSTRSVKALQNVYHGIKTPSFLSTRTME